MDCLRETLSQCRDYKLALLQSDHKLAHTEKNFLYVALNADGSLQYAVRAPDKKPVSDKITPELLEEIHPSLKNLQNPLTPYGLSELAPFTFDILQILAQRGHAREPLHRSIKSIESLKVGETLYHFNAKEQRLVEISEIPDYAPAGDQFLAVKVQPATIRIVLYSLDINAIKKEFMALQSTVTGWTMQGSNLFTRNLLTKTTESCASLAYRCLNSGGLSSSLPEMASLQTSSLISPDDLLRRIVTVKKCECLAYFGSPEDWQILEVEESSMDEIEAAYFAQGQDASVAEAGIPEIIPSLPTCSML